MSDYNAFNSAPNQRPDNYRSNPYERANNEFHKYCGSKGEPVTLGELYRDVARQAEHCPVSCSWFVGLLSKNLT